MSAFTPGAEPTPISIAWPELHEVTGGGGRLVVTTWGADGATPSVGTWDLDAPTREQLRELAKTTPLDQHDIVVSRAADGSVTLAAEPRGTRLGPPVRQRLREQIADLWSRTLAAGDAAPTEPRTWRAGEVLRLSDEEFRAAKPGIVRQLAAPLQRRR